MTRKKKHNQRKEIIWNIVNALIAGMLVFLGSMTAGNINETSLILSALASLIVFITKINDFWQSEKKEYCRSIFDFI